MRTKMILASVLAFGMFAVVQAQQGRGGFGMFGGGVGASVSMLVSNKAVQEDLKLSEDQVAKVKDWAKDFKDKAAEIYKDKGVTFGRGGGGKGNKGNFTPPTTEEKEKMAAATAEVNKVAYKELGDVLKPEQIKRLKEIQRQALGLDAFSDAETATALKLTDAQKTAINGFATDLGKERRDIMKEAGLGGGGGKGARPDPEKMKDVQTKTQKLQKDYITKAVDQLNEEQKKTWTELIGAPFDTSKLVPQMRKQD